jgi:hypothetical protein
MNPIVLVLKAKGGIDDEDENEEEDEGARFMGGAPRPLKKEMRTFALRAQLFADRKGAILMMNTTKTRVRVSSITEVGSTLLYMLIFGKCSNHFQVSQELATIVTSITKTALLTQSAIRDRLLTIFDSQPKTAPWWKRANCHSPSATVAMLT